MTLTSQEITQLQADLPQWQILHREDVPRLQRTFSFDDFAHALAFTNRVGAVAEEADHHPVLVTEWGQVTVTWWSHESEGLERQDFELAAQTDEQYGERSER